MLSLDVVLGTLCGGVLAVAVTGARMPLAWWFILPVSTWIVYAVDHLWDARRTGAAAHTLRHRFYHRHHATIARQTAVVAVLNTAAALWFLPARVVVPGLLLGLVVLLHLLAAQRAAAHGFPKELSAAWVYTVGIWFAPLALAGRFDPWWLVPIALHFAAALGNLIVYSLFEYPVDLLDHHGSIVCSVGESAARRCLVAITLASSLLAATALLLGPAELSPSIAVLTLLMWLPGVMDRRAGYFGGHARYRVVGDLAFVALALPATLRFLFRFFS